MHVISPSREMEAVSDYLRGASARSLDLLRTIDGTIDALVLTRREMDALSEMFEGRRQQVFELDAALCEKQTIPALEQSQESLLSLIAELESKHHAAVVAPELRNDDGVVDAYEEALTSARILIDKIEQMRWAILEHNADMEKNHTSVIVSDAKGISDFLDSL